MKRTNLVKVFTKTWLYAVLNAWLVTIPCKVLLYEREKFASRFVWRVAVVIKLRAEYIEEARYGEASSGAVHPRQQAVNARQTTRQVGWLDMGHWNPRRAKKKRTRQPRFEHTNN